MERHGREGVVAFFVADDALVPGMSVPLGDAVLHHVRVRRIGVGTRVALLNGRGDRGEGTLIRLTKNAATVEIEAATARPAAPPVHLLVPIADRDRTLWLAEKCAELELTSWRPVMFRRSRSVNPRGEGPTFSAKLCARMQSALEQSGGSWLPAIYPEATLDNALAAVPDGTRFVLDPAGTPLLQETVGAPVSIAVGPEGGLDDDERRRLDDAGFRRVALGGNILRFETAALAAVAIARTSLLTA